MYTIVPKCLRMANENKSSKLRLVVHVSDKLRERLDKYVLTLIEKHGHRKHGALSFAVEKALREFLDREEVK